MSEEKRIYVVLANTVQNPLIPVSVVNAVTTWKSMKLVPTPQTKTIVQPAGRLIAQAAHVVSKVRSHMLHKQLSGHSSDRTKKLFVFEPITTIVLSARDSFELNHVRFLLHKIGIRAHDFYDTNQPDYGDPESEVMTAIATEPVTPDEVVGILDYLPLWKP